MCDGRLFHRRVAATRTGYTLLLTVDRRVCQTSRDVEAECSRCMSLVSAG